MFCELVDVGVAGEEERLRLLLGKIQVACCCMGASFSATFHSSNCSIRLMGCSPRVSTARLPTSICGSHAPVLVSISFPILNSAALFLALS